MTIYDLGLLEHGVYPDEQCAKPWLVDEYRELYMFSNHGNNGEYHNPGKPYQPITIKRLSVEHQEHDDEAVDGMRLRGFLILDKPMV